MSDKALDDRMEELGLLSIARYLARSIGGDEAAWQTTPCKGCGYMANHREGARPLAPHDRDCPIARFVEQFAEPQLIVDTAHAFASWMAQIDRAPNSERFGVVQMVRAMMHNTPSEAA